MNVVFLTNNPHLRSTTRALQYWLERLPGMGVHCRVIVPREGELSRWLDKHDVPCRIDPMPWPDRRKPLRTLRHTWRAMRWCRRRGVDLIHCNEHNTYPFAQALKSMMPRPIVCHIRSELPQAFAQWAFGKAQRKPDAVLWNTGAQRDKLVDRTVGLWPDDAEHILPPGIDVDRYRPDPQVRQKYRAALGLKDDAIVIGTASSIQPLKRTVDFVEVVEQLAQQDPRVVGLIAGRPKAGYEAYAAQVTERVKRSPVRDRIRLLGTLSPIAPFMQSLDLYVSTSEYESFGNSIGEAMACGSPAVGYDGGAVGEVIGPAGYTAPIGDVSALIAPLRNLIRNPTHRRDLGRLAMQRIRDHYHSAQTLKQLIGIYQNLRPEIHHVAA